MDDALGREFEVFVLDAREGLVALGIVLTGDIAVAQDLAQEALVRAWQRWPRLRGYEQPAAWTRKVLHNLAIDRSRRIVREQRFRPEATVSSSLHVEDAALLEAIRSLDPAPRKAIFLHYFIGLPIAEIGVELGVPLGTVGSWLSRGRAAIAEQLERPRPNQTGGGNHE